MALYRSPDRAARPPHRRRRMVAAGLVLLVVVAAAVFLLVRGGGGDSVSHPDAARLVPGSAAGDGIDPLRYTPARQRAYEQRAAAGLAHVLYAKSIGGAAAAAQRVDALRPTIERAAQGSGVDPDVLEAIVFLESGGRPDAQASNDLSGAVGLTQILADTATDLLGMKVDLPASTRLTKQIAKGRKVAVRTRLRARVDQRFDPARALAGTVRYLQLAKKKLGSDELAIVSYHMGIGNVQTTLKKYGAGNVPYAQLFFGSSPLDHASTYAFLATLGDDSSTYLWRVRAAEQIMRDSRADPQALAATTTLQTHKNSAEEVLRPRASTPEFARPADVTAARAAGVLKPLDARQLARYGLRIDPGMGELAQKLGQKPSLYRALTPNALATLLYLGAGVQAIAKTGPLTVTSSVRDDRYQALLVASNIEATRAFSLHTTGNAFDVSRVYRTPAQAQAMQFMLDRLTALNLIAWVREPAAIHVTVGPGGAALRGLLARGAPVAPPQNPAR